MGIKTRSELQPFEVVLVKAVWFSAVSVVCFLWACSSPGNRVDKAFTEERSGNYAEAFEIYASVSRDVTPAMKLPNTQKGKVLHPSVWMNEIEKYIKWVSQPVKDPSTALPAAMLGLERCEGEIEFENTFRSRRNNQLKSSQFKTYWNKAFTAPPPGSADWDGLLIKAREENFSIFSVSSKKNYFYDFSIISSSTSRRIDFSLYPESKRFIPLPPGEYMLLCRSSVDFQKGQRWESGFSVYSFSVPAESKLISLKVRTSIPRQSN
ncbi:MAG: hypothetical protein ACLFVE_05495 [Chitinispirillaceae bacterium]